jgi:G3E family GTPase
VIPLLVIGGYLGVGKTTLLNHVLRHAQGLRIGVMVNDFGAVNIDADLIEGAVGEVLALAGGCVRCSAPTRSSP